MHTVMLAGIWCGCCS